MASDQAKYTALAISIAADAHLDQLDRGGNAYILHPLRIMFRLRTHDQELMQIAALHDVLEDSEQTIEELRNLEFSPRVLECLRLMTKPEGMSYEDYIHRGAPNIDFRRIKMEDLRDNLDINRLKGVREKDFERLKKYNKAYLFLSQWRENVK